MVKIIVKDHLHKENQASLSSSWTVTKNVRKLVGIGSYPALEEEF